MEIIQAYSKKIVKLRIIILVFVYVLDYRILQRLFLFFLLLCIYRKFSWL